MPDILTVEQTARYLQVNPETVRRAARSGRIPAVRIGRHWRIRRADLDAMFSEAVVDRGLVEMAEEAMAEVEAGQAEMIPWDRVKAELDL